ncbi:MAG: ABC transporter ATP-binding protein/permease [Oscillospiraceae bacterium]|nr:ABC transporter ATP-binding protein/permease [Oscillospiraceae bacterium]
MQTRETLINRLTKINRYINEDDIVVVFEYNLKNDSDNEKVDGFIVVLKDKLFNYLNDNIIEEFELKDVKEFKISLGVGCIFIECKLNETEEDRMICRSDMAYNRLYAAITKRLNKYLEQNKYTYNYEEEMMKACPKCGRPFAPGSTYCEHCVKKKEYLKRLYVIAKPYRKYIFITIILFFIITACTLITPYISKIIVDEYIVSEHPELVVLSSFIIMIIAMVAVDLFSQALGIIRSLTLIKAGNSLVVKLRELIFNKIQQLSLSRISKRTAGELMHRVTGDTSQLQHFITREVGNIIEQLLIFIAIGTYLFIYNWQLALMIILPLPVVIVASRMFWRFIHRIYHRQWNYEAKSSTMLHDIFSGIRVVKSFGMEKQEKDRYDEQIAKLRDTSIKNERFWAIVSPFLNLLVSAGEFFLLYYVGSKVIGGEMTLGQMAQFSVYVGIIYGPMRWMGNLPRYLVRVMTSIVKIFDIIDEKIEVSDKDTAVDLDIKGYIDIENMSFGYDETVDVLKNINLSIKPGEMIGIVGRSGVGKSTLINLVMRLYDVGEGSIKIDGVDLREISQESLRSQIGVVLQETFLFSGTIYDNIAYAKADATRDEIITASKIAGAHQFIMKLPEAYNTKVGERGYTLSGGERQRVSIARALLHDPRILILDEATASLDCETEKQIQDSLQKLIKDRTTLAIAHRLSTLRNATRLIVLDKGTVAEVGTHEELLRKKGIYYGLVMAQRQMSKMSKEAGT